MRRASDAPAGGRVLVVGGSPDGRTALRLLLEAWGHQVQEAADGREGVEKALGWRPDFALVDVGLPRLAGYELARVARRALGGHVRLVALAAWDEPGDRERAFEAGFDHYLARPADPQELARLLGPA